MKATLDIPSDELRDAMRFTKSKTKREAIIKAIARFNVGHRTAELVKCAGSLRTFPSNDEIEAVDATRDRRLNSRRQ
jgi:hypothetical protein